MDFVRFCKLYQTKNIPNIQYWSIFVATFFKVYSKTDILHPSQTESLAVFSPLGRVCWATRVFRLLLACQMGTWASPDHGRFVSLSWQQQRRRHAWSYRWNPKGCHVCQSAEVLPSLKLTAKAPENGWLEYEFVSFWGKLGLFSGAFAVSFRYSFFHPENVLYISSYILLCICQMYTRKDRIYIYIYHYISLLLWYSVSLMCPTHLVIKSNQL